MKTGLLVIQTPLWALVKGAPSLRQTHPSPHTRLGEQGPGSIPLPFHGHSCVWWASEQREAFSA